MKIRRPSDPHPVTVDPSALGLGAEKGLPFRAVGPTSASGSRIYDADSVIVIEPDGRFRVEPPAPVKVEALDFNSLATSRTEKIAQRPTSLYDPAQQEEARPGSMDDPERPSWETIQDKTRPIDGIISALSVAFNEATGSTRDLLPEVVSYLQRFAEASSADQPSERTDKPISQPSLTVPTGEVERYQGKRISGDVFTFLQRVYTHEDGGEPLTLAHLRRADYKAYQAYFNESSRGNRPEGFDLPKWGEETDRVLSEAGIDLSTVEGEKHARRVMNAINVRLYPRP